MASDDHLGEDALERMRQKWARQDGRALVVGSKVHKGKVDRRLLYAHAYGVDMLPGVGVDLVHDLEQPLPPEIGQFAHVDCCSVLEHVRRPWFLCENIERAMLPGATILISVPWVWRFHAYDHDYYRFSRSGIVALFPHIDWKQLTLLCGGRILKGDKVPSVTRGGTPYLARTEIFGCGVRK